MLAGLLVAGLAAVSGTALASSGSASSTAAMTDMAQAMSNGHAKTGFTALGVVWLLDAALQYQPFMFTKMFPAMMLAPSGAGEPAFVSGPMLTAERLISGHIVPVNAMFATLQLALAAGLLCRATARAALAGTIAWSLAVWWLGEGLGGIFSATANPLTGAPGAALLYAFLAILGWPRTEGASVARASSVAGGSPLGRGARVAWFVLWATMAGLMLAAPAPSSSLTAGGGPVVTIMFAAAFALVAVGLLVPATVRAAWSSRRSRPWPCGSRAKTSAGSSPAQGPIRTPARCSC